MIVRENIGFRRTGDAIKSLSLGKESNRDFNTLVHNLLRNFPDLGLGVAEDQIQDPNYVGFIALDDLNPEIHKDLNRISKDIIKWVEENTPYIAYVTRQASYVTRQASGLGRKRIAYNTWKVDIVKEDLRESVEFMRGQNPKAALGLGKRELYKKDPVKYLKPEIAKEFHSYFHFYIEGIKMWKNSIMGNPNDQFLHIKLIVKPKDTLYTFKWNFHKWWKENNIPYKITQFKTIRKGEDFYIFELYANEID